VETAKKVEEFISKNNYWKSELEKLRKVCLSTGMEETIKWGAPVYMIKGKNIVGLGAFKSYVGIWFFQGGLLKDKKKYLVNAQEGKTKALRQWRFNSEKEIVIKEVKNYLLEAINNQKEGKEIKPHRNKPLVLPVEIKDLLKENKNIKSCFEELSLSKRREYAEYIAEPKKDATKANRITKIIPLILENKGLNDRYKNC
jgi:uncharacterized protein YdeI (YjbR/CyaY-like superfamily)